jgi:hypothetical protein
LADSEVLGAHNPTRFVNTNLAEKVLLTGLHVYSEQALPARPVHGKSTKYTGYFSPKRRL